MFEFHDCLNKKMPLHNNGSPIRNWLHAKDTASGIMSIINANVKNEIYNICGGYEQSNLETFQKVLSCYGITDIEKYTDLSYNREGQDLRYALNDDKLRKLGWAPTANFDLELKEITNYYKNNFIW